MGKADLNCTSESNGLDGAALIVRRSIWVIIINKQMNPHVKCGKY